MHLFLAWPLFSRDRRLVLALAIIISFSSHGLADWPHLRGPRYDGVCNETGLADNWPAGGPAQLWACELGQGYSGFVFANGKVYTQRQSLSGQYLVCLDPDDGRTIWEFRYDWAWQPKGAYPGPYATPTWYRGKIFYVSTTGKVGCVDAETGAEIWSFNVKERFKGKGWGFGFAATPLVEDDKMILPVGGPGASLVALHVEDGRTMWQTGDDAASYCPALPLTFAGQRCVAGYLQNAMILVDLASGKLLHRELLSGGYDEHSAWPIYQEPHLLLTGPFRAPAVCYELQAAAEGRISCKLQWTSKELCNDVVSSVLYEGSVFGFDLTQLQASRHRASHGLFKCVNWSSGKLQWETEEVGHAAPLVADGKLILLTDTGTLILARADPTAYRELARTQLFEDEICWTPPLLMHGRLFVRSPSRAICIDLGSGARQAKASIPVGPPRGWSIRGEWLLSREREYPNDAPTWQEMGCWFVFGLLILAASALGAVFVHAALKRLPGTPVFFGLAFLLGVLGPNLFSALADEFLFSWPVSLFVAFQAALSAYVFATRPGLPHRARWLARLAAALFLLVVYLYYEACRAVGMYIFWCFLIGFPPALPLAYLAVRAQVNRQSKWAAAFWIALAFTAFFWSCQAMFLWKISQAD
jgi:outer membrane protein assembly factor BamB